MNAIFFAIAPRQFRAQSKSGFKAMRIGFLASAIVLFTFENDLGLGIRLTILKLIV